MSEFATFQKNKEQIQENKNEARAPKTLEIYRLINDMLQNPDYESNEKFLVSVQQFIEEKQYVSDKQIEIVERIFRHHRE